jgi:hypothetical protein
MINSRFCLESSTSEGAERRSIFFAVRRPARLCTNFCISYISSQIRIVDLHQKEPSVLPLGESVTVTKPEAGLDMRQTVGGQIG